RGGDFSAELGPAAELSLTPYVSYVLTRNEATGATLRDVPRWRAGGTARWRARETVTLSVTAFHVGALVDNSIPTGDVRLAPYQRVDLAAEWRPARWTTLYLAIENLLDHRYQEAVGFPSPGLFIRAGAAVSF